MGHMEGALHLGVYLKLLPAENPNTDNNVVNGANTETVSFCIEIFQIRMLKQQGNYTKRNDLSSFLSRKHTISQNVIKNPTYRKRHISRPICYPYDPWFHLITSGATLEFHNQKGKRLGVGLRNPSSNTKGFGTHVQLVTYGPSRSPHPRSRGHYSFPEHLLTPVT